MLEVAADPKRLGAESGFLSSLHTWGQNLLLHPHVHCVVPAGGLAPDHQHWIHPRHAFLLPVKVLGRVCRGKFIQGLRRVFRLKKLHFSSAAAALAAPKQFAALVKELRRQAWVVDAKAAFGGPAAVLPYLGHYTQRVAISNHRIVAHQGDQVTFRWKDYARGNQQRLMTLSADEFLRRFVQPVPARGFVRIRQFGLLANACRTKLIAGRRQLLAFIPDVPAASTELPTKAAWKCPHCGAPLHPGKAFGLSTRQAVRIHRSLLTPRRHNSTPRRVHARLRLLVRWPRSLSRLRCSHPAHSRLDGRLRTLLLSFLNFSCGFQRWSTLRVTTKPRYTAAHN